jgi:multidrug efflux pump
VVDDAIVVVEAVEHHLEHGLSPKEATYKAMEEVSGPIVAITLVLASVFIPCAFITGVTGKFFQQFAVTIAVSVIISGINSLTLSPALCAVLLRSRAETRDPLTRILNLLLGWFFKLFNGAFNVSTNLYGGTVRGLVRVSVIVLALYAGLLYGTYWGFTKVPGGFIPNQDKGYGLVNIQLPDSASLERSAVVLQRVDKIVREVPGVRHTVAIAGQSFLLSINGSNLASLYVVFDEFEHRHGPDVYVTSILHNIMRRCHQEVPEAIVSAFGAPPIDGLGSAGGFKIMIQDRADAGPAMLQGQVDNFAAQGSATPGIAGLFSTFRANTPQLYVDLDRTKCKSLGVPLTDVFNTLQVFLGGMYVNDFNRFGRTWQVNLQSESMFRVDASGIGKLQVRNTAGQMIPLTSLARIEEVSGPLMVMRYNMYAAAAVNGAPAPGVSSGEAIRLVEESANRELASSMSFEWTEITLLQILAGNTAVFAFGGAVVLVFLILAAQYESWAIPLSVILVVPMCVLSSLVGVALAGLDLNIFTQIGFVVLVGLACKNAILIVEFAKMKHDAGQPLLDATVEACKLRLRPIMMTSFAFILGVVPLAIATGAGAEMRRTLGIAVFSGMLGVTIFGICLTPVFFYVILMFSPKRVKKTSAPATPASAHP